MQLRRDVLPALTDADVKLFAVGIGSADSAKTFAEKVCDHAASNPQHRSTTNFDASCATDRIST